MQIATPCRDTCLTLPLQSHHGFGAALAALGRDAHTLGLFDAGSMLGQLVLIRRRFAFGLRAGLATRGPVWATEVPLAQRVDALRHLRNAGLTLVESDDPDPALARAGFRQILTAAHVAEMDLTCTPAARTGRMATDWRNKWRKASRAGLDLRILLFDGDPDHWLLRHEAAQRRQRRYHALPVALTAAYAATNPGQAMLFQADLAGQPVAAMLMLRHGAVATYQHGWTGPVGRRTAAHQLLLMMAADWLAERGCVRLDLGTVDSESNPGLARFKIGSGAALRRLGGSWLALPGF